MKLYLTAAGIYAGTQKEAGKGHTLEEVPTDKYGLIDYLNALKFSPVALSVPVEQFSAMNEGVPMDATDHGERLDREDEDTPPTALSPASQASIDMDEAFEKLPLARQLHFAAVAMENARLSL